jgi:hypothetical protein
MFVLGAAAVVTLLLFLGAAAVGGHVWCGLGAAADTPNLCGVLRRSTGSASSRD